MADFDTRPATLADAGPITEIYNQGIADRIATFETELRTAAQIEERNCVIVERLLKKGAIG